MKLTMHIGLHKTGTTALQNACRDGSAMLADAGVHYSTAGFSTMGTAQHLALSGSLRGSAPLQESTDVLLRMRDENPDAGTMLVSSEDLSTFFGLPAFESKARALLGWNAENFDDPEYFCVIRDELSLIRSIVIQTVEGEGFPRDGRQFVKQLAENLLGKCERIASTVGPALRVVQYEKIPRDTYSSSLLSVMLGKELVVGERQANVTANKDILRTIFGSNLRRFFMNTLDAGHPYANEVNVAWSEMMNDLHMETGRKARLLDAFTEWLDRTIEEQVAFQDEARSLTRIFEGSLVDIPAPPAAGQQQDAV
ncbi:MAG: hypothetical protein JSU95_04090 [Betaproteobacteria bacterium]|nr:MAG: hypothetical protein JSU95_04090 [Betaproteobacteria bacterium]